MATLQDILSGNFPAAQRYAEGYAQMPSYLQDPYLGLSTSNIGKVTKGLLGIQTPEEFAKLAEKGKINIAKDTKQEIGGLLSGKSKFAELPNLNWDDPKTYDLVDPLIEKGFKAKTIQQGPDTVTLLYKNPKDIKLLETARNPYEYGKAYGYSDADIAHFYNKQFGDNGFNMLLQAMGQPKSLLGKAPEVVDNAQGLLQSSTKLAPELKQPFIGYMTKDGFTEMFNHEAAKAADYHHSHLMKDPDKYFDDNALSFVRMGGENVFTVKGNAILDPYKKDSSKQLGLLAKKLINEGADPNAPFYVEDLALPKIEAPYQGKQIGTLQDWLKYTK